MKRFHFQWALERDSTTSFFFFKPQFEKERGDESRTSKFRFLDSNGIFMSQPHLIRLPSPWSFRVVSCVGPRTSSVDADHWPTDEPIDVQVPADWSAILGTSFRGRVEYSRFFNRPTGIDAETRIQLRLELVDGLATVSLNHELLGTARWPDFPKRFDITGRLQNRNELCIAVELLYAQQGTVATARPPGRTASDAGGLVGEVHLEIG